MKAKNKHVLALDVGEVRVGLALLRNGASVAYPLTVLERTELFWTSLDTLLVQHHVDLVVIGLPRTLDGNDSPQTNSVREFANKLKHKIDVPIVFQDEALTSRLAEESLQKTGKPYKKADIDALAASIILNDYVSEQGVKTS